MLLEITNRFVTYHTPLKTKFDYKKSDLLQSQKCYYFKLKEEPNFYKIEQVEGKKIKIVIDLLEYKKGIPSNVNIKHNGKNLKISMKKLEQ